MILIYPPVSRACEPPLGSAFLAGAITKAGIQTKILDLNLEGQLWLMHQDKTSTDSWGKGAVKRLERNLDHIRTVLPEHNTDKYKRALFDLNKNLMESGRKKRIKITLTDYEDETKNALARNDLIDSAKNYEDNLFFPFFSKRIQQMLFANQPVFGISLNYISQALCAFAIAGFLRDRWPTAKIILGGSLVTSWMKLGLLDEQETFTGLFDILICGPGEEKLCAFLGCIGSRGKLDFSSLSLDQYFSPGRVIPYSFSSGCSWKKCSFCPEFTEGNLFSRKKSEESSWIISELVREYKPLLLHFTDSEISPADLKYLVTSAPGASWYGFVRFSEHLTDLGFCLALKRSGCQMLQLGLESGSQTVLDALEKGIRVDQAQVVLQNLKQAGILTYVYVLFGTPAEDREKAIMTVAFLKDQSKSIDFFNLAIFNMPRFSAEAKLYGTGQFYEGELGLYTAFNHPAGWSRKKVREFINKELLTLPELLKIDKAQPPFYTSSHAAFF